MTQVSMYDQHGTRFADFVLPELPHVDDEIEIALPGVPYVKCFTVERVVHRMVYDSLDVKNDVDTPWHWEILLHGFLCDPEKQETCACAQGVVYCPKHGNQPAVREFCPVCKTQVLGYCAAGVYCTDDDCKYYA